MQECCSESLGALVTVAKLAWALKVGSSFQRFGSSSGSKPGKQDEERDVGSLVMRMGINNFKSRSRTPLTESGISMTLGQGFSPYFEFSFSCAHTLASRSGNR